MKISVTQQHIDRGVKGSATSDPIALALLDAGWEKAYAGASTLKDKNRYAFTTPPEVYRFMRDFDTGRRVEPFDFELEGY